VLVTAALLADVPDQRTFVGTVWPVRRSLVGSAAPGRVEEYLINEGDPVKAGQPIAKLRHGVIQAELNGAKAIHEVRLAELKELETSFQDEVEQAQAKVAIADANLTYRHAKLARSKSLGPSIARELLEEDSSLSAQAVATVREAQSALRLLTDGARQQKTEQAPRARSSGRRGATVEQQFDRHTLFAPFDGVSEHTESVTVMQGDPVRDRRVEMSKSDHGRDYIANLNAETVAPSRFLLKGHYFKARWPSSTRWPIPAPAPSP
jgi:multidrug efflux pump subunit AcrA (membrane-fusion protein)